MDCIVCGTECANWHSCVIKICYGCRDKANFATCEYCGNRAVDPTNTDICLFCVNPQSAEYHELWLKNHPEQASKYEESHIDDWERERELSADVVNNFTCPRCKNNRCNTNETKCWSCEFVFPREEYYD